jgi:hypothetical protein
LSRQDCADLLRVGERQVDKRCGAAAHKLGKMRQAELIVVRLPQHG